jgi:hypothetical protein
MSPGFGWIGGALAAALLCVAACAPRPDVPAPGAWRETEGFAIRDDAALPPRSGCDAHRAVWTAGRPRSSYLALVTNASGIPALLFSGGSSALGRPVLSEEEHQPMTVSVGGQPPLAALGSQRGALWLVATPLAALDGVAQGEPIEARFPDGETRRLAFPPAVVADLVTCFNGLRTAQGMKPVPIPVGRAP